MADTKMFWGRSDKSKVLDQESFKHHYNLIKFGCNNNYDYNELKEYANNSSSYDFSVMTTKLNIFGLIQLNTENKLEYNEFFNNFEEEIFFNLYSEYYLSYWQEDVGNGVYVKPYLLLLEVFKRLKEKSAEAYLTVYEFKKLFNQYKVITDSLIEEIILKRQEDTSETVDNDQGTLGYSSRGYFKHSTLLNFSFSGQKKQKHYFVELKESKHIDKKIDQLLLNYISKDFYVSNNTNLDGRERIKKDNSDWGRFLNNKIRFNRWFITMSIHEFKEYCSGEGFQFSDDLIRRFILSLETKPFLLLTGISGSGKTKIAEHYGNYLNSKARGEKLILAIGSNWNDGKKLLGFNNPLQPDPDLAYQKTPLVKFIQHANENLDKIFIIILDEMNLSYTEKYFSDFLSALESIEKEISLPNGNKILWSKNLKIIGTINEDETTHTISPKILDRANVIEMNGLIPSDYIDMQIASEDDIYKTFAENYNINDYKTLLNQIYTALNGNFAFRIMNEITLYININKAHNDDADIHSLLDEQIYQKILPKIHGSKLDLPKKLSELKTVLEGTEKEYLLTNNKIKNMLDHVSTHGYASFIMG